MKYYEVNGKGNTIGALGLQCPICGNTAMGILEKRMLVTAIPCDGGLLFRFEVPTASKDDTFMCPQCNTSMENHEDVKKAHKEAYNCPGCIICGNIYENVFQVCRECVINYKDVLVPCTDCEFNYSRIQMGIDVIELKEHYNIEKIPNDRQLELFDDSEVVREAYINPNGRKRYEY